MKLARVLPLFKNGDALLPDNYRPISLLPVISKVLERIVYTSLTQHLESNHVLYLWQYGFRRKHSTVDAVMNFVGEALQAFNSSQFVLSIFIDLKKCLRYCILW